MSGCGRPLKTVGRGSYGSQVKKSFFSTMIQGILLLTQEFTVLQWKAQWW